MPIAFVRQTLSLLLITITPAIAQTQQTAPIEGLRDKSPRVHALTNARIVVAPGKVIDRGTLVVRNGVIEAVGAGVKVPTDARVWDLTGRTLYPGFIDSYSYLDLPKALQPVKPVADDPAAAPPTPKSAQPGAVSWNARVTPQRNAGENLVIDAKQTEKLRSLGFTTALVVPGRGIFRGSSTLINLSGLAGNQSILKPVVAQHVAFEQAGFREDVYPTSLMGAVALVRQTFLDADWYRKAQLAYAKQPQSLSRPETNEALAALAGAEDKKLPVVFEADDELDLLRGLRIAAEMDLVPYLRGNGYEYRMIQALQAKKVPVILPLDFPAAPEVETPEKALDVTLESLQHWEQAASNPARLAAAGVPFAFTTAKLARPEDFWTRLRKAVGRGLSAENALAALTTTPARLFNISERYGTLDPGKVANLVVADGDLFTGKANVLTVWVDGQYYPTERAYEADARGTWKVDWTGVKAASTLTIKGEAAKPKVTIADSEVGASSKDDQLILLAPAKAFGLPSGVVRLTARVEGSAMKGSGQLPDGQLFSWQATRTAAFVPPVESVSEKVSAGKPTYPAGEYGLSAIPVQNEWVLVRGATVWTSGPAGRLPEADVLVNRGKIVGVGRNLSAPAGAVVIDGRGKHVTPGLIDAHSHTAISQGINEGTHAITSEVRIGDVLDPTDISIYRELAGGLTVANVLHGSANPIGGQNQVIKLRWGGLPEDLKFEGAPAGIKFALGENVKQSFRERSTRYPQSRMGVEQLIRDAFTAARDYELATARFKSGASAVPVRRDLQLEALVEILQGKRLLHSHSYRQDEILMLVRLAEQMNFKIATFQHVLEGYKVAEAIARSGAGGSSFSDWWGYKYEVVDAIPENGALMARSGVVVSFNSDSNDLARRMNTEAAKAVKYGGMSEEEALKFVTLNPAKQLHIERRVGSLEAGKDADFVLWSGSPLSAYSRAEQTWIDGRLYFDLDRDRTLRESNDREREALIQKALVERQKTLALPQKPDDTATPPPPTDTRSYVHALEHRSLYHDGRGHINCSDHDFHNLGER